MTPKGDEKLTGCLKNNIRNLVNFHGSIRKPENLHFDGLLLSIAYKVSVKMYRRVDLKSLKSNLNFEGKMTFYLKNDMRSLVNFNASSKRFKKLHFHVLLFSKACNV